MITKYKITDTPIPFERRSDVNNKILSIINCVDLPEPLTKEDIYNGYTGIGGLHGLEQKDFENYHKYSKAKKEFEQGQFLTNGAITELICKDLPILEHELICDLTCGTGNFFNHFNDINCYGCEIDHNSVRIVKYLYPYANIQHKSIHLYKPGILMDFVIGNPPFNLKWEIDGDQILSQHYYCKKAFELLKPGGVLLIIVPDSYLKDEFFTKSAIEEINDNYSFIFQYKLEHDAFKNVGCNSFHTKVMCFQKRIEGIEATPYQSKYVSYDEVADIFKNLFEIRKSLKLHIRRDIVMSNNRSFKEKVRKYLYEFKVHPKLKPYHSRAVAKLNEFNTQQKPEGMSWDDWEKNKLTENRVLNFFNQLMKKQLPPKQDIYKLVKTNYGIKYKPYTTKGLNRLKKEHGTDIDWNVTRMLGVNNAHPSNHWPQSFKKWFNKKLAKLEKQQIPFDAMGEDPLVSRFIERFGFYNNEGKVCKFNDIQKADLKLILQKDFAILNWEMGGGKSMACAAWAKFKPQRNTFIISAALAIELTWVKIMKLHNRPFINIKSLKDVYSIQPGMTILVSVDYAVKYRRHLAKYIKMQGYKVNLVFDESDEITNANAKRTKAVLSIFRRCKRKLLATGTTTRNNITEIYSQFELLYNNSQNLKCTCPKIYMADTEKNIVEKFNDNMFMPFPAKAGALMFKRCFNPASTTVLGIEKHDQHLYNESHLRHLLSYTVRTRRFKEIAGEKYTIVTRAIEQNEYEREVYSKILNELMSILNNYFNTTGSSRKDAMLRALRQMTLLIKAVSMPQLFDEYGSDELPNRAKLIFEIVENSNEKIAIGCTFHEAVNWYKTQLSERFPDRPLFIVVGDVSFANREKIRVEFENTTNGILLCTQQSLKSSVNIPTCNKVIMESKQWNIPKMKQFFFRFIRYDSQQNTEVIFINTINTIDINLMALLMAKERLNDYIKTLEFKEESEVYGEYDVDMNILDTLLTKETDADGKVVISWGKGGLID